MGEISIADTYKVLESALRPLSYWYNQDNVEEVAVDSPGGIWLRLRGRHAHPWHYYEDPKLTREFLNNIMYIIANSYDYAFDPGQGTPTVYATLPGGHRFTGIAGRNVMYDNNDLTGGIAIAIRVYKEDVSISMSDFGLNEGARLRPLNRLKQVEDPDDPFERLMLSIKRGDHVLISGATATGKTTFLNNLIKVLDIKMIKITKINIKKTNIILSIEQNVSLTNKTTLLIDIPFTKASNFTFLLISNFKKIFDQTIIPINRKTKKIIKLILIKKLPLIKSLK